MFKGFEGKVIHSELHVNADCVLYFVDILNGKKESDMNHILLDLESEEEINKIYNSLSKNGTVKFELQKNLLGRLPCCSN